MDPVKEVGKKIHETNLKVKEEFEKRRKSVFERFPLPFTLLGAFGLVATFYGFERVIDQSVFLSENPWVLLATGLVALIVTGNLYKKLQ